MRRLAFVNIDDQSLFLVVSFAALWARAAEADDRLAVARAPWLWGLTGGAWTWLSAARWNHSPFRLLVDQLAVLALMMLIIEHGERRSR